jgi:uncharacterized protein YhbP (UPF0306 family)
MYLIFNIFYIFDFWKQSILLKMNTNHKEMFIRSSRINGEINDNSCTGMS